MVEIVRDVSLCHKWQMKMETEIGVNTIPKYAILTVCSASFDFVFLSLAEFW